MEGEDIRGTGGFSPEVLKAFLHQARLHIECVTTACSDSGYTQPSNMNYDLLTLYVFYFSEEDLEKLLATYAKQNKSSVFLGGRHDATTSSPQCYTTSQGSSRGSQRCDKPGHKRAMNTSVAALHENPKTTSDHPQLRKNPFTSQVDQQSACAPVTRTQKYAWTGNFPPASSLYSTHCTEHAESSSHQDMLTRFLAGVNCNSTSTVVGSQGAGTGADPGERKSSAAGRVRLKPHQRSLSVQSVASTTTSTASSRYIGLGLIQPWLQFCSFRDLIHIDIHADVSQKLCHLRRLSSKIVDLISLWVENIF